MVDKNGNEVKVGDKVHYFGWHNMKPTGIVEQITTTEHGEPIVIVRNVNAKPGTAAIRRLSESIELIVKK